jgi:hypothetical protein
LPTKEEEQKYGSKIIQLKHTLHNDMDDDGTANKREKSIIIF